jgi:hypothetical protein
MNSPMDGPEKYAPKWVRESNPETRHENPSTAVPQHSEQSVPKDGLSPDQTRAHRPLARASLREALDSLARRPRPQSELPEGDGEPPLHMHRSPDPRMVASRLNMTASWGPYQPAEAKLLIGRKWEAGI